MHVMLDLETWGTRPGSALRSIGAVRFNLDGVDSAHPTFYRNISKQSCYEASLTFDQETIAWWDRQSPEANAALSVDPRPIADVAKEFHGWFSSVGGRFVWCHGANFDEPLWTAVCRAIHTPVPWKFWNVRCTRTLYAMMDFDPRSIPREGTHHNALDDAIYQVKCVQAAMGKRLAKAA